MQGVQAYFFSSLLLSVAGESNGTSCPASQETPVRRSGREQKLLGGKKVALEGLSNIPP